MSQEYIEIRNKGYESLDNLIQLLDEVVDKMQEADIPLPFIKEHIEAEMSTVFTNARNKQIKRWTGGRCDVGKLGCERMAWTEC